MSDSEDRWPLPNYNPGATKHLHAIGVIAVTFAAFERSVESIYFFYPQRMNLPDELINLYYFSLNEEKRLAAIREVFRSFEQDPAVVAAVENVLSYFQWCRNVRNQILHAERYPASFGADPDTLYLTKRMGKQSPQSGYMNFKLPELRSIADRIRAGIVQSATIHIHLRVRNLPIDQISPSLRIYATDPLPKPLEVPDALSLSPLPRP
jgi:hypothetical protein